MNESGIQPAPREPLIADLMTWSRWESWFSLIVLRLPKVQTYTVTINPASVAANTSAEQTFTVAGLTTEDIVYVNKPSTTAGLVIGGARVSAADTLAITFGNLTGSGIDAGSESYFVVAIRR